jgi:hypothetical protein
MATRGQCEDHAALTAALATEQQARRDLERERDEIASAVIAIEARFAKLNEILDAKLERFDRSIVAMKIQLARWGGILTAIAALPLVVQIVQLLIRAAEAAGR